MITHYDVLMCRPGILEFIKSLKLYRTASSIKSEQNCLSSMIFEFGILGTNVIIDILRGQVTQ